MYREYSGNVNVNVSHDLSKNIIIKRDHRSGNFDENNFFSYKNGSRINRIRGII